MRRHRWLVLAALLLVGAALLFGLSEREAVPVPRASADFPSYMRYEERARMSSRATLRLPSAATADDDGGGSPPAVAARDPFLVSLPVTAGEPVVVLEANALRHSRLGELLVGCLTSRGLDPFASIERDTGIDLLEDIDRVGVLGHALVVSGFFERARWSQIADGAQPERYGTDGRIYLDVDRPQETLGIWREQLLVFGDSPAEVRRAFDQLEGRAPVPEAGLGEEMTYGEVYGIIPGSAARELLGSEYAELADRIARAATRMELHVDAMDDVAAVVRVSGGDAGEMGDLAKAIGAALALGRVHAQATRSTRAAELLDLARVVPAEEDFSLELALPRELLERWFERCGSRAPDDPGADYLGADAPHELDDPVGDPDAEPGDDPGAAQDD